MAERRMFAKTIIDSDAFLDMPLSTQALYFHLSMRADDDGFLNNYKKIMRTIGANQNDYDLLLVKNFLIQFDDGICVIKHWRIHNYIRNDRYKPTVYQENMQLLGIKDNKAYTKNQQEETSINDKKDLVYQMDTQVRLGKDSIDKYSILLENEEEYLISSDTINEYKKVYTLIDVESELLKMKVWSLSNPTKRKTSRGITRFINGWLNRANQETKDKQSSLKKEKPVPDWYDKYQTELVTGKSKEVELSDEEQQELDEIAKGLFK